MNAELRDAIKDQETDFTELNQLTDFEIYPWWPECEEPPGGHEVA
jgi:hypothetical protein